MKGVSGMKFLVGVLTLVALSMVSPSAYAQGTDPLQSTVEIRNPSGQVVGTITFTQVGDSIQVTGNFSGLPPGVHDITLGTVGDCSALFNAAAGISPAELEQAINSLIATHFGALPPLQINPDGTGVYQIPPTTIPLQDGTTLSVYHLDGSSLVLQIGVADPSGATPGVFCGVVVGPNILAQLPSLLPDTGTTSSVAALSLGAAVALAAGILVSRRSRFVQ